MSQPEISPLAKRLAEENNVDWHALQGSGPEGKVVERDVLEYLSRVMTGEEDINPTPEPTPDGIDSWPEEDIANYQQTKQPSSDFTAQSPSDDILVTDDLLADDIDLLDDSDFSDDINEAVFLLEDDDDMAIQEDSSFVEQLHNDVDASGQALYGRESRIQDVATPDIAVPDAMTSEITTSSDLNSFSDDLLSADSLDDVLSDDLLSDDFADMSDAMDESLSDFSDDLSHNDFADSDFSDDSFTDGGFTDGDFGDSDLGDSDLGDSDFGDSDLGDSDFGDTAFSDSDDFEDVSTDFPSDVAHIDTTIDNDLMMDNDLIGEKLAETNLVDDSNILSVDDDSFADDSFNIEDNDIANFADSSDTATFNIEDTNDSFALDGSDDSFADDSFANDSFALDSSDDNFADGSFALDSSDDNFADDSFADDSFTDDSFALDNSDDSFADDSFADGSFALDSSDDNFADDSFADDSSDDISIEETAPSFADGHDADLLAMDMDSTISIKSTDISEISADIGYQDSLSPSDDFTLGDHSASNDADLLAMDNDTLIEDASLAEDIEAMPLVDESNLLVEDTPLLDDIGLESSSFDSESDHEHFSNIQAGEGAMPLPESELHSDFDSFDSESDHDHLGDTLDSVALEAEAALAPEANTYEDSPQTTDAAFHMDHTLDSSDDIFASDDAVFSELDSPSEASEAMDDALEDDLSASQDIANFAAGALATEGTGAATSAALQSSLGQESQPAAPPSSFESNYHDNLATPATIEDSTLSSAAAPPVTPPVAMPITPSSTAFVSDTERSITLRRYLDLELFNELQEQIVAALGEEATVAMVQKAALKALEEVPLTGHNVNIFDLAHNHIKVIPNAADMSLSGLVRAMHHSHEGASDMLVADLSRLEVDEIGMDVGVPLLTLGRILWSSEDGQTQSSVAMLALSGNVNPEMGSRFLAVAAEMLENPLLLLL